MRKTLISAVLLAALSSVAQAQYGYGTNSRSSIYGGSGGLYGTGSNPNSYQVDPYVNRNGTYVPGHRSTKPNGTQLDNYGTQGNYNPYTGQYGTKKPGW